MRSAGGYMSMSSDRSCWKKNQLGHSKLIVHVVLLQGKEMREMRLTVLEESGISHTDNQRTNQVFCGEGQRVALSGAPASTASVCESQAGCTRVMPTRAPAQNKRSGKLSADKVGHELALDGGDVLLLDDKVNDPLGKGVGGGMRKVSRGESTRLLRSMRRRAAPWQRCRHGHQQGRCAFGCADGCVASWSECPDSPPQCGRPGWTGTAGAWRPGQSPRSPACLSRFREKALSKAEWRGGGDSYLRLTLVLGACLG